MFRNFKSEMGRPVPESTVTRRYTGVKAVEMTIDEINMADTGMTRCSKQLQGVPYID